MFIAWKCFSGELRGSSTSYFVLFIPTDVFYIVSSQNCMVVNYKKEGSVSCKLVHDPSLTSDLSTYGSVVEQG